jgi:hypothetical protein
MVTTTTTTVVPPVNVNFNVNIHYKYRHRHHCYDNRRLITMALSASSTNNTDTDPIEGDKNNNNDGISINQQQQQNSKTKTKGYRFGNLTRGALKKVIGDVDLTRGALKKIKGDGDGDDNGDTKSDTTTNTLTPGTKKSSYKFGDISKWLDKKAKDDIGKFTNKQEGDAAYQFGDISKELIRRLRDGEYTRDDLLLFIKVVATIGINLTPVARILPLKVLTELLNLSLEATIAQSIGDKMISSLTNEIDSRMKEFVTGNREYQYEFGDLTTTIFQIRKERKQQQQQQVDENDEDEDVKIMYDDENSFQFPSSKSDQDLFDEWDKKLLESRRREEKEEAEGSATTTFNDER